MSILIAGLAIYPVKSCAGIALQSSGIGMAGLHADRRWMIVDAAGRFLSQRTHPRMALIGTALDGGFLTLTAPRMPRLDIPADVVEDDDSVRCRVRVWKDEVEAVDEGELAAQWCSTWLGAPCRLVKVHPESRRLASVSRIQAWQAAHPVVDGFGVEHVHGFADGYPVLVANLASLRELNGRLAQAGRPPVEMERFRANIVVDELGAFDEDYTVQLTVGEIRIALVKPCTRCPMPGVDPATGEQGEEPMRTLSGFRREPGVGVLFGMNGIVQAPPGAVLRVGDRAQALLD